MPKSILIHALITALLGLATLNAYAIDKCKVVKRVQSDIDELKNDLTKMEAIHREQVEAKEIADRLLNGDEVSEIGLLAKALDDEVKNISSDQSDQTQLAGVSVGAVVLSSYIIKKLNKQSVGFKRKFLAQALPKDRRFFRHTMNATLVFSVASTFWLAHSIKENQDKKKMLAEIVIKLNSIKNLTDELITLREEIEEKEVLFNIQLEQLIFEGLVEVEMGQNGKQKLTCIQKK